MKIFSIPRGSRAFRIISVASFVLAAAYIGEAGGGQAFSGNSAVSITSSVEMETDAASADGMLARIVFITTGKACKCTLARCERGEEALKKALAEHPKAPKPERLDYSVDTEKARNLMKKYPAVMLPVIYFLDSGDNLLWKVEGDFDWTEIDRALKEYSAAGQ